MACRKRGRVGRIHVSATKKETQHGTRLSKLVVPSAEKCRAFCGTVDNSPGVKLRVGAFCIPVPRRLRDDWIRFPTGRQFSRPARSRTRFPNNVHPGLHHRAILNRAAKGAALLSDDALFAGIKLDRPAACYVSFSYKRIN